MTKKKILIAFIVIIILVFLVILFIKNSSYTSTPSSSLPQQTITPQPTASSGQETATKNQVIIEKNSFNPQEISIKAGDTVTWVNNDSYNHTVTGSNGAFDSGNMASGTKFSFTFPKAGTFSYACSIHPFMQGSVVVSE
ncbi:MAG: cupredoxin family copper-binding protein [Candidatus Daviesbacteria bacterium]|nr:cupredoxin family copper-binding protein [Candidatus Daviesbacteria bacterium]